MTKFNKPTQEEDWDALAEKRWDALAERQLAAIKRSTRATTEDAVVRAAHKVKAEFEARNAAIEEVAQHIEKLQGFGNDTISSFAIYIREMKK